MIKSKTFKRLYQDYTKRFIGKILLAALFSVIVALSTSATAWLLDPAIEKIFINKDQTLIILIPIAIIIAFSAKGISLYFAKLLMINVSEEVKNNLQVKNENGRQFRIPQKNVIAVLNAVSYENFCDKYSSLNSSITSMCEEIETELLWEMVVDDNREYKCSELADNYFGDQEGHSICSAFCASKILRPVFPTNRGASIPNS